MKLRKFDQKTRLFFALAAVFLLVFPSASMLSPAPDAEEASKIALIFTGDVRGHLEPCG